MRLSSALVVDDHPLFCDALAIVLRSIPGMSDVSTVATLEQALNRLNEGPVPDIVLLDLNLPDVAGLDGLMRLKARIPAVPVVVVSSMADNRMIHATLSAGATGFVPKHSQRDVLQQAFTVISDGGVFEPDGYFPPSSAGDDDEDDGDAAVRLSSLTRQQTRILDLICEGKLNKQIAYDLTIAETTVKAHVTAIMRKLGVQSRTQAVLVAQRARYAHLSPDG